MDRIAGTVVYHSCALTRSRQALKEDPMAIGVYVELIIFVVAVVAQSNAVRRAKIAGERGHIHLDVDVRLIGNGCETQLAANDMVAVRAEEAILVLRPGRIGRR